MTTPQPQSPAEKKLVNGLADALNGHNQGAEPKTATEDMKEQFKLIKDRLPDNWLDGMLAFYPSMLPSNARKLIDRLKNIFLGRIAPTTDELARFKSLCP